MGSFNSEKDPGCEADQIRHSACPHNDGYTVSDFHKDLLC